MTHPTNKKSLLVLILRRVYMSVNPADFEKLIHRPLSKAFKHFFLALFLIFIVMSLFALPKIITLSSYLEEQFSSFDTLNIDIDIEMNSPLIISERDPQIIIDTTNQSNLTTEKLMITKDFLYYKPYNKIKEINYSGFKNVLENKEKISNILSFFIILALPSILITIYIMLVIKYLFIAFLTTIIAFIIARIKINPIKFKKILKASIYSLTSMIIIEVISAPFSTRYLLPIPFIHLAGMNFYLSTTLLYVITFISATWFEGKKI